MRIPGRSAANKSFLLSQCIPPNMIPIPVPSSLPYIRLQLKKRLLLRLEIKQVNLTLGRMQPTDLGFSFSVHFSLTWYLIPTSSTSQSSILDRKSLLATGQTGWKTRKEITWDHMPHQVPSPQLRWKRHANYWPHSLEDWKGSRNQGINHASNKTNPEIGR